MAMDMDTDMVITLHTMVGTLAIILHTMVDTRATTLLIILAITLLIMAPMEKEIHTILLEEMPILVPQQQEEDQLELPPIVQRITEQPLQHLEFVRLQFIEPILR